MEKILAQLVVFFIKVHRIICLRQGWHHCFRSSVAELLPHCFSERKWDHISQWKHKWCVCNFVGSESTSLQDEKGSAEGRIAPAISLQCSS